MASGSRSQPDVAKAKLEPVITEVKPAGHRVGKRWYAQRTPHPSGVYPPRHPGGRPWVQVRVNGVREYGGVVSSWQEGIALVADIKRRAGIGVEPVITPTPIVTKRRPPVIEERPWATFGR